MTDPDLISRFRTDLIQRIAAQERVPAGQPLPISPWLAMSMLQKAVRRGRDDLALNAAATLLRDAPDRLWRRLGGIAFEDVGLGGLPTVGLTVAALTGKRFRAAIGGDWAVASVAVKALAETPKSRATDDLYMALETLPALADTRRALAAETNPRLRLIALTTPNLHCRALATLFLLGTDRPGGKLPGHHPDWVFTYIAQKTQKGRVRGQRYPITYDGSKTEWRRIRDRAKINDLRFHDLRHDFGSRLLRQTGNLKLAQKAMNHADIKTTMRYVHVLDEEVSNALEIMHSKRRELAEKLPEPSGRASQHIQLKRKNVPC